MAGVDVERFLRTGAFGPIRLGLTEDEVRALLGDPDATGGTSRRQRTPKIWKYGDVELHFDDQRRVQLVFFDDFDVPSGGRALTFDPWILRGTATRAEVEGTLRERGIAFEHGPAPDPGGVVLTTSGGVELAFHADELGVERLGSVSARSRPERLPDPPPPQERDDHGGPQSS